jgi:hypothetical protein
MTPTELVLSKLPDAKRNGSGYSAKCPGHDDRHASLSIGEGADGRVLLHCHAGCESSVIVSALGLSMKDLMPPRDAAPRRSATRTAPRPTFATANDAIKSLEKQLGPRSGMWTYHNAEGEPCGVVIRWNLPDGSKDIRPVSRHGNGWRIGAMARPRPLYRLPEIRDADPATTVYVVEGEKTCDAAMSLGLLATTSAGGSQAAKQTDWTPLAGRNVVILPDHDGPGQAYADDVVELLHKLNPPASGRVVELPGLGDSGDMYDFIEARRQAGKVDDEIKAEIDKLVDNAKIVKPGEGEDRNGPIPVLINMADVRPVPINWLWPNRIALGKMTLLAGDPGLGKSLISLDIAARVSTGKPWPLSPDTRNESGGVVLLTAEDDLADTVRPRLDAAGADATRVVAIQAIELRDKDGSTKRMFTLERDLPALEDAIRSVKDCRLVVVDPISAYLGKVDSHTNADVRGLLAPLAELAAHHAVAIVAVNHLRKGDGPALYRSMGSLAFIAAARAGFMVTKDKDDPDGRRRLFLPAKNNLSDDTSGLAYMTWKDDGLLAPYVRWLEVVTKDVDEALAVAKPKKETAQSDAAEWLRDYLADGVARPSKDIEGAAKQAGISSRTLWRAKEEIGVKASKSGFGGAWAWRLPGRHAAEDCQAPSDVGRHGNLGSLGSLRVFDPENAVSEGGEDDHSPEGCQDSNAGEVGTLGGCPADESPPLTEAEAESAVAATESEGLL